MLTYVETPSHTCSEIIFSQMLGRPVIQSSWPRKLSTTLYVTDPSATVAAPPPTACWRQRRIATPSSFCNSALSKNSCFKLYITTQVFLPSFFLLLGKTWTKTIYCLLNLAWSDHLNSPSQPLRWPCPPSSTPGVPAREQISRSHGRRKQEGGRGCPSLFQHWEQALRAPVATATLCPGALADLLSSFLGEKMALDTKQNVIMPGSSHSRTILQGFGLHHLL